MRRKATLILPSFCLVLPLFVTGCGRFKKPSTVVHSLYMDCENGEYPKARNLFIKDIRETFDGAVTSNGPGIKGACDRLTQSGTLSNLQIVDEAISGDNAVVISDLYFQNDGMKRARTHLIREEGAWKVSH